jgi:hypothetical protein
VTRLAFLFPAAIALYGAYVMWNSLMRMTYYDSARGAPGPGFLPFWLAVGLIALGGLLAVRALRATRARNAAATDRAARIRPALALASLALLFVAFEPLGFVISVACFVLAIGYALGLHAWRVLAPAALGAAIVVYALFTALGVALPAGALGI